MIWGSDCFKQRMAKKGALLQGDLIEAVPRVGFANPYAKMVTDSQGLQGECILSSPAKHAVVLSHSCDLDDDNVGKSRGIILAAVLEGPPQIDAVRTHNILDPSAPNYLNVFAIGELSDLPPRPVVDFSRMFSLSSKCLPQLIKSKIKEMKLGFQEDLKVKVAYFFGRP